MPEIATILKERFGDRLRENEPLAPHTTFGIGGPADLYLEVASREDLIFALQACAQAGVPRFMLGGGSNLLVSDLGVEGLVIKNTWAPLERDGDLVFAGSGVRVRTFTDLCLAAGLTGAEFMAGLPGSLGGALYGNAGAYGKAISDLLIGTTLLTADGDLVTRARADIEFSYRDSALKRSGDTVVDLTLRLERGDPSASRALVEEYLEARRRKHPGGELGCAGSYFKNLDPPEPGAMRLPAGRLLEEAGAKAMRVGGAGVFEKHANMIVNLGGATAADVLTLAERMKAAVRERFGRELEEEVLFVGRPMPGFRPPANPPSVNRRRWG